VLYRLRIFRFLNYGCIGLEKISRIEQILHAAVKHISIATFGQHEFLETGGRGWEGGGKGVGRGWGGGGEGGGRGGEDSHEYQVECHVQTA